MKRFLYLLKQICFILIVLLVVLLALNVFMRYIVRSPFAWTEEAGQLLLVWLTFLGAAVAGSEKRHMGMDWIAMKFKGKSRKVYDSIISLFIMVSLGIIIYNGIDLTLYNLELKSESLQFSFALFYLAIPVGCSCYLLFELNYFFNIFGRSQSLDRGQLE